MFGGPAFLIGGNMAISASGQGEIMVLVDLGESDVLVVGIAARLVEMRGRRMPDGCASARRISAPTTNS
jgi:hypothetical protein